MNHPILRILAIMALAVWASSSGALPHLERVIVAQLDEVAARPNDPAVYNDLGNLYLLANRFDDAEKAYLYAKELAPSNSSARFNLGLLLQQEGRLREAYAELSDLLEIDPQHAWAHYQLGMIDAEQGERSAAVTHYAKAFALDPSLTFERQNPHIIDNKLATEALLRSSRYQTSSAKRVPRSYDEGARIRDLMLVDLEVPGEEPLMDENAPGTADGEKRGSANASLSSEEVAEGEVGRSTPEASASSQDGSGRVLTNQDLAGIAAVGQASGSVTDDPSGGRGSTRRPGPSVRGGEDEQSRRQSIRERINSEGAGESGRPLGGTIVGGSGTQPTPQERYRPSRRSTASLNLELLDDPAAGV